MKEKKSMDKTLAFFDFDGTITKRDSFLDFLLHSINIPRLAGGTIILLPVITGFLLKLVTNEKAKQTVLSFFFKGIPEEEFYKTGDNYGTRRLPAIVKKDALQRIIWHKQQGHRVVVISASLKCWLQRWCEKLGVELICTRMEVINGHLTGRFDGKNCYGPEKERRIRELFSPDEYYIYAYGDSRGDNEMLALADEKFYRFFKK
jgi:HAD superfamily hydrolase (TIGR01490 family)